MAAAPTPSSPSAPVPQTQAGRHRLFVYGTLKAGYPNHGLVRGQRIGGRWATVAPHPLWVVGEGHVPWLMAQPGEGHTVYGEVYEVDDEALAVLDVLEDIHSPLGYRRVALAVQPADASAPGTAPSAQTVWAYLKDAALLQGRRIHAGPLAEYPLDAARAYSLAREHAEEYGATVRSGPER